MAEDPVDLVGMNHVLNVIGFEDINERDNIMEAGLAQFEDFCYLVEKDIRDMADEFWEAYAGKRTVTEFDMELVATNSKAADPGKLKDERKWPKWEKAFTNYLSVIPGVSGIPLSFIVREQDEPTTPGMEYSTFNEQMVHRALLTGQYFIADARRVHNLLVGFLQGENTENWIRNFAKYQDGRRDMIALRHHCAGEGNSTRRIADAAKRIQNMLHYKTERALPFNKFLDSLQRMFTIFEEENEPLMERAKVEELLTKVQNTSLAAAVAQLRYQLSTESISFTVAVNHLNSKILQTSDYQLARKRGMNLILTQTHALLDLTLYHCITLVAYVTSHLKTLTLAYHPERDVPIVTGATAYTDQATGQVYILVINKGLWFGEMLTNSLINPNQQLRYAGVAVQDNPFHPTDPMAITHNDIVFPLQSQGTTIFFDTSTPTQYELDHSPHIILTLDTKWNPHTVQLAAVQSAEAKDMFGGTEPGLQQISLV
ncbi:Reverse transcriptase (RNA-dependent DNA polymerase) [Fragilaria crotonensis]|nr:Reverse transcriptase (RNA-dependent DNA polymerase) [Fragilaria crotonensis]